MSSSQLTLIQGGEFIVCENPVYTPAAPGIGTRLVKTSHGTTKEEPICNPAFLTAISVLPINTMKSTLVRIGDEIIPLPFIRSQERKVVSDKIRIEGPLATRIAESLGIL